MRYSVLQAVVTNSQPGLSITGLPNTSSSRRHAWKAACLFACAGLLVFLAGCSGSSGGKPFVYPFVIPTTLSISGSINLANVAVSPTLGGITPSARASLRASLLDHSPFTIEVEDDPKGKTSVTSSGTFQLPELSIRDQIVVRARNRQYPGFTLEWMGVGVPALLGPVRIEITVPSTARSAIVRTLRNRYGRLMLPEALTDAQIVTVTEAMYDVLERHPEKLSSSVPLSDVPEVLAAVAAAAAAIDSAAGASSGSAPWPRDWTVLVYQGGDNSLEPAIKEDLEEMKRVSLPASVALLVQTDTPAKGIRRLWIRDGREVVLGEIGQGNSADAQKIADFASWAQRAFPARRFALIIASHGLGWRGTTDRSLITDDSAASALDYLSLAEGIKYAATQTGGFIRPFDLIGFDACLMGMIEVAYQLRTHGRWLVFSQANEPASGWPYEKIMATVGSYSGTLDGETLGHEICAEYQAWYEQDALEGRYSGTLSLIYLEAVTTLTEKCRAWAENILNHPDSLLPALAGLRDAYLTEGPMIGPEQYRVQAFELTDQRDLYDLVSSFRQTAAGSSVTGDAVLAAWNNAVRLNVQFGNRYTRAHGLSIALPSAGVFSEYAGSSVKPPYAALDFPQATRWHEVLYALNVNVASLPVDSRSLQVALTWNTTADIDLLIGEPDSVQSDSGKTVWFSPADGIVSGNGRFSADSLTSGLSEESWKANTLIRPGVYWVVAHYHDRSALRSATTVSLTARTFSTNKAASKAGLLPGQSYTAFRLQVTSTAVTIETVPEPELSESIRASIETWTTFHRSKP